MPKYINKKLVAWKVLWYPRPVQKNFKKLILLKVEALILCSTPYSLWFFVVAWSVPCALLKFFSKLSPHLSNLFFVFFFQTEQLILKYNIVAFKDMGIQKFKWWVPSWFCAKGEYAKPVIKSASCIKLRNY